MDDSAAIRRLADEIESKLSRLTKMQGLTGSDHCDLIVAKGKITAIRDRHRAKLGFIPKGETDARDARIDQNH